jgi:hypothetical protein
MRYLTDDLEVHQLLMRIVVCCRLTFAFCRAARAA